MSSRETDTLNRYKAKLVVILALAIFAVAIVVAKPGPVEAKPTYMDRYDRDAYAKRSLMGKCTVCHIGRGGGERNDFGEAFEDGGYRITPRLRKKFPQFFTQNP